VLTAEWKNLDFGCQNIQISYIHDKLLLTSYHISVIAARKLDPSFRLVLEPIQTVGHHTDLFIVYVTSKNVQTVGLRVKYCGVSENS